MSRKTITFSIINAEVNPEPIDWEAYDKQMLKPEEQHSIAVQDIMVRHYFEFLIYNYLFEKLRIS